MFKVIFAVLFALVAFSSISLAQPKIHVEEGTTLDFGTAYTGSKVDRILTIKNLGNDTLRITDVKAQCGCTAAMMNDENRKIAPSGTGKLSISFDTRNYGGQHVTKQVTITSNDTSNARLTLAFNVSVLNVLDIVPPRIGFNDSKIDSTSTRSVTITNPGKESVRILSVTPVIDQVKDQIKVELMKKELRPGESTQLQVTFHPTKSGSQSGVLNLETDSKIQSTFQVQLYTWVVRK